MSCKKITAIYNTGGNIAPSVECTELKDWILKYSFFKPNLTPGHTNTSIYKRSITEIRSFKLALTYENCF